ncbi:MAG: hypothetical protein AB7E85_03410 [Pseudobdellovibrionaceae bacterium]
MERMFRLFFFGLAFLICATPLVARADYFVWKDAKSGVSLSYPDTWRQINNYAPDDVLTIAAPGNDQAQCRVRVRDDGRFKIYPQRYQAAVQREAYSLEFWNEYLASYHDVMLHEVTDGAGLGQAFASMVKASYVTTHPMKNEIKTAIAAAGLYYDKAYILDCSSLAPAFAKYYPAFLSIYKSVDMDKMFHELPEGENRGMDKGPIVQMYDGSGRYLHQE